jgi:hypothetical protein
MKLHLPLVVLVLSITLLSSRCKKQNTEPQLPPETTTGAMTFGCKVNGKVFVPKTGDGVPGLIVEYPFLGNGPGGGWYLNIAAVDRTSDFLPRVSITSDSLFLIEGTYQLKKEKGFAKGQHGYNLFLYQMSIDDAGVLTIIKHNQTQRIIAGRFSFTATNNNGERVSITEGRFDVRY